MDILTGLLCGVCGFALGFFIAALVAGSRIEDERLKAYKAAYEDAVQKSLDREQELIDYLTEDSSSSINRNPFYEQVQEDIPEEVPAKKASVGGMTVDLPKETCYSYDFKESRCLGTKEMDFCTCRGDPAKCDFYEDVREKAKGDNE